MDGRSATIVKGGALALLCVASGVIGAGLSRQFGESTYRLSYVDFISIMLTAVSVLMTTLAIFLAVLGVIGWNSIQNRVQNKTGEFLTDEFQQGRTLYTMMENKITEIMYQGVMPALQDHNDDEPHIQGEGQ